MILLFTNDSLRGFFPNIRNKKEKNKERKDENKIL
jgi:hypothetical protein